MWELESETQGSAPALCCDTYEQNNYTGGYIEASTILDQPTRLQRDRKARTDADEASRVSALSF